jgi:hypothetical protein
VYYSREELEYSWEQRFQADYGVLRHEVLKALDEYLNCGLLEHGAARVYCDSCKHSLLVAFSCKKRGICPSCGAKRAVKFAEHLHSEILQDVPYRHIVFSIPKRLRPYFRYDRKLCHILFTAAWRSLEEHSGVEGAELGLVLTLQTAGEALNWNPHLHGMLADRIFSAGGSFQAFSEINQAVIQERFCELVLSEFAQRELITDDVMSQILSQEYTGFSFWTGDPFTGEQSEKFVARYIERSPLSLEKLSLQDDIVTYTTKDGTAHEFEATEFLALLTSHIPNKYESITRYYGYFSSRSRGERIKKATRAKKPEEELKELPPLPSSSWAACIKKIYEIDPLECPRCKGQMRIIAFLQDPVETKKIMESLGLPQFRAPPPIPKPPRTQEELFIDQQVDYDA